MKIYKKIVITFLVLILITFITFWLFLDAYEKSQPFYKVDYIITNITNNKSKKIVDNLEVINKNINTSKKIETMLNKKYKGKTITYTKNYQKFKKDKPVYDLLIDNKIIGTVYLKENGTSKVFKLTKWKINKIENLLGTSKTINIIAPNNYEVYVDDYKLKDSDISDPNYQTEEIKILNKFASLESINYYLVKGIYDNANIYGILDKKKTTAINDSESNLYKIGFAENKELLDNQKDYLTNIIKNYTRYVVNEQDFTSINKYLIYPSNTYTVLKNIGLTNVWLKNHTPTTFSEIKYSNMKVYGDNAYSIMVTYTYSYIVNGSKKEFPTTITLYMVKKNNTWLVASLKTN